MANRLEDMVRAEVIQALDRLASEPGTDTRVEIKWPTDGKRPPDDDGILLEVARGDERVIVSIVPGTLVMA